MWDMCANGVEVPEGSSRTPTESYKKLCVKFNTKKTE
jgi:hypothetical protein